MPLALRQFGLPLLLTAAVLVSLYATSPNFRPASGSTASPYAGDFLQEWVGGWIVRAGERERLYDLPYAYALQHDATLIGFAWDDDQYLPMVYPPFYYALVAPLSLLSVTTAAWLWAMLMVAALAASCWSMQRPFGRGNAAAVWAWLPLAAVLFAPVIESLSSSQKGTLCLLLFTLTLTLWQRGRPFPAGAVFGLLAFKPQLAIVVALAAIWKRDWRFVGGALGTGALLAAVSLAVSPAACADYFRFALGSGDYMQTAGYDLWKSHTVWGFGKLLAPHDAQIARSIALALAGPTGYCVVRLSGGIRASWNTTSPQFRLQFAGLVVATVLLSPHLFTYDLTILLLPMAIVLHEAFTAARSAQEKRLAIVLTLLVFALPAMSTGVAARFGLQLTVPLMLVYLALITRWANAYSSRCGVHSSRQIELTRGSMAVGDEALTLPSP